VNLTPERLVTIAMTNRVPALAWTLARVRYMRLTDWMMLHWGICGPTAKIFSLTCSIKRLQAINHAGRGYGSFSPVHMARA